MLTLCIPIRDAPPPPLPRTRGMDRGRGGICPIRGCQSHITITWRGISRASWELFRGVHLEVHGVWAIVHVVVPAQRHATNNVLSAQHSLREYDGPPSGPHSLALDKVNPA